MKGASAEEEENEEEAETGPGNLQDPPKPPKTDDPEKMAKVMLSNISKLSAKILEAVKSTKRQQPRRTSSKA